MSKKKKIEKVEEKKLLKLDFGCGPNPREGFDGVDIINFNDKVKYVVDLMKVHVPKGYPEEPQSIEGYGYEKWPWEDNSVEEAHASHLVEHFNSMQRCHFVNELYRILVVGGKCTIITPHWASCRAYGDPTHCFSPVSEFWYYYLLKEWRMGNTEKGLGANAPHTDVKYLKGGFNCDFDATWGYSMHPSLFVKNQEMQQFALQNYKEAAQDLIATLVKRAP